jgi:hypothetical protein
MGLIYINGAISIVWQYGGCRIITVIRLCGRWLGRQGRRRDELEEEKDSSPKKEQQDGKSTGS